MPPGKVKWLCLSLAFLLVNVANAQQDAFQITFTDKNNTPYTFTDSLAYLSPRSLERRIRQHITLDSTDLPVNPAYIDSVLALTGGLYYETSRWLNMCIILLPAADSAQVLHLAGKPFISSIKEVGSYCTDLYDKVNHITTVTPAPAIQRSTSSDGAYYNYTWGQTQLVNGNYLHDQGYNGAGKLIAVLDAGFIGTNTHPWFDSMWAAGRVVDTFDFTYHNSDVFGYDGHGTEVLSTMAGYVPDSFVGTAPLAMYALYITEYDPDDQPVELDNMIAGAERADSIGADVITESLGYDLFQSTSCTGQTYPENFDSLDGKTTVAAKAANIATKKGMLFVATAGNDGSTIPGFGDHIMTPGDADSALTIGAVDISGTIASFSGFGPNAAGQIKPDVCAMGVNTILFNPTPSTAGAQYMAGSGTSFSTPQVAGWAACLWEASPLATPAQIRHAIIECASMHNDPDTFGQYGYGIANFECTAEALNIPDTPSPLTASNWVIATPNPFNSQLTLSVTPNTSGNVDFRLMDMAGREVFSIQYFLDKGYNPPISIAVSGLPTGIYILKAISSTQQQVLKLNKRP